MIGRNLAKGQGGINGAGLFGDIQNRPGDIRGGVRDRLNDRNGGGRDKLNDIAGAAVDSLTRQLDISQWYSLHIMDSCEGVFDPSPRTPNPGLRTLFCTNSSPSHVQDKIDLLNDALLGLFIVYALAVIFSGLSMLLASAVLVLSRRTSVVIANLVVAGLGVLVSFIGSVVIVSGSKVTDQINERDPRIGISAERGYKFAALCWVTTGLMLALVAFWVGYLLTLRRKRAPRNREGGN